MTEFVIPFHPVLPVSLQGGDITITITITITIMDENCNSWPDAGQPCSVSNKQAPRIHAAMSNCPQAANVSLSKNQEEELRH
jgi:hypothetical protein